MNWIHPILMSSNRWSRCFFNWHDNNIGPHGMGGSPSRSEVCFCVSIAPHMSVLACSVCVFHCCITPQRMRFPNHVMLNGRHLSTHRHYRRWLTLVYLTGRGPTGNCWKPCPAPGCGFFIPVEKRMEYLFSCFFQNLCWKWMCTVQRVSCSKWEGILTDSLDQNYRHLPTSMPSNSPHFGTWLHQKRF